MRHNGSITQWILRAWCTRPQSRQAQQWQNLIPKIKEIFAQSRETYGYRRICDALKKASEPCGKHRTASLMRKLNLTPRVKRRVKVTTDSKHRLPIFTNVLNHQFNPSRTNQAWASDITYIATEQG